MHRGPPRKEDGSNIGVPRVGGEEIGVEDDVLAPRPPAGVALAVLRVAGVEDRGVVDTRGPLGLLADAELGVLRAILKTGDLEAVFAAPAPLGVAAEAAFGDTDEG